jgi:Ca-activated chloride channel family protein
MMDAVWHTPFEYSWVLWGLIPWTIFALGIWRYRAAGHKRFSISQLPALRQKSWRQQLKIFSPLLPWLSGVCILFALAGPYERVQEEKVKGEGIDIFISLDLSASMLARDFEPNRLEVAKNVAADFSLRRPFDRIGVAAFAGEAYTVTPLTTDKQVITRFIQQLNVGQLKDGTAIGMGLATAVNRLSESDNPSRVIILLTDGVNNSGYIAPRTAMEIARQKGIKVYTIGVGTRGQAPVPYAKRNGKYAYRMAKVDLDEALLQEIAQQTGGLYFRAQNEQELKSIYAEIDQLEKSEVELEVIQRNVPALFPFVLSAGCILLVWSLLHLWILKLWP